MIRVETDGSYWEIDPDLMRYRRAPKGEAGREFAEWGNDQAGALQDFIWHPCTDFYIDDGYRRGHRAETVLILCTPTEDRPRACVIAPNPIVHKGELRNEL